VASGALGKSRTDGTQATPAGIRTSDRPTRFHL
jgi:hypothetical protein